MQKFVIVLMCVVATCVAYDFNDRDFNDLIFDSMRDLKESLYEPAITRFRRETEEEEDECKAKLLHKIKCCNTKVNTADFKVIKALKQDCYKELFGEEPEEFKSEPFTCDHFKEVKSSVLCITECVAKKLSLMDDSGEMKKDVILAFMKDKFKGDDDKWKLDAAEGIVDKCLEHIQEKKAFEEDEKCSAKPLKMTYCIWKEFVKACPAESQVDSTKCNKLRERLESGKPLLSKGLLGFVHDD